MVKADNQRSCSMSSSQIRFPPEAIAALEQGNTIVAIKLVRSANDMDLRTAKQTVEAYLSGERSYSTDAFVAPAQAHVENGELPSEALAALAKGRRVEAVKIVREHYGLHLKEAKDKVDAYIGKHPSRVRQSIKTSTVERDRTLPRGWWIFLGLLLLAAFYFLR
jgi:ribosomal protein L7/L12